MGEPGDRERPAMAVGGVCEYRGRTSQGQRAPFGAIRFDGLLLRAARHFLSVCDRPIGRVPIQAPDTGQSVSIRLPLDVAARLQMQIVAGYALGRHAPLRRDLQVALR